MSNSVPYLEDRMGMTVTSGVAKLKKNEQNLVGISIGGGYPFCPCLYIVQIFDNTPAAIEGSLAAGDEIVSIQSKSVKGRTKVEVAKIIQRIKDEEVVINYNKLHAEPKQGKSFDLNLKKIKHKIVEGMSSSTADALGLSRAILCNDSLVKRMKELERIAEMYKGLVTHTKNLLKPFLELSKSYRDFGDIFSEIGVREPQPAASKAFSHLGDAHRNIQKFALQCLTKLKPMVEDLNTFLNKAVPDTKLTIKKYLDAKFEYLSYCLKIKEMDDEEYTYTSINEVLYRVETGNYEYRLILRCRQMARKVFAKLRSDVMVKLELLDQKHVQDVVFQLQRLITAMATYHSQCNDVLKDAQLFPIEVDLLKSLTSSYSFTSCDEMDENYKDDNKDENGSDNNDNEDDDDDDIINIDTSPTIMAKNNTKKENDIKTENTLEIEQKSKESQELENDKLLIDID